MNFNEYQKLAQKTANQKLSPKDKLINAALGLSGESGEFADLVKKHVSQGHELDSGAMFDELGDILWYLAEACAALTILLEDVACGNIIKLEQRYPDGFDTARSVERLR